MSRCTNFRNFFVTLLLLVSCISTATGKQVPVIKGTVHDEKGKPVAKAEVANLSNSFYTYTDAYGRFEIRGQKGDRLRARFQGKLDIVTEVSKVKNVDLSFDTKGTIAAKEQKKITKSAHAKGSNHYKDTVIGQVLDENGLSLPGVSISIKGTAKTTTTDIDGYYGIDAKVGDIMVASFIGYQTMEIKITHIVMNFSLRPSATELSEVVVVGYGTMKKESVSIRGVASGVEVDRAVSRPKPATAAATVTSKSAEASPSPATGDVAVRDKAGADDLKYYKRKEEGIKPGQLTAGEVDDFSKWDYWEDLTKDQLAQWRKEWQISPTLRYSVSLVTKDGYPVVNKKVNLTNVEGVELWSARTDNTGKAELWYRPDAFENESVDDELQITDDNGTIIINNPKEFHEGINTYVTNLPCNTPNKIDVAFMVDATGSMGDEISYLQAELYDVLKRIKDSLKNIDLRMGSVFYRDKADEYLLKAFDLTSAIPDVVSFIKQQNARGGGDYPEAATEAFETSIDTLGWSDDARTRLLFVVLDAPPHNEGDNIEKLQKLAAKAAKKGIRIIPVAASGIDKSTEYLMRAMALQTNGTYLFLTNHSGIGNNHIEPSTDSYKVETLNELLLRIILQMSRVTDCKSDNLQQNNIIEQRVVNTGLKLICAPNPTTGKTTVTISNNERANSLGIFDATGKLLMYFEDKNDTYNIDLTSFPDAVYYVKAEVNGSVLYGKIIKQQ